MFSLVNHLSIYKVSINTTELVISTAAATEKKNSFINKIPYDIPEGNLASGNFHKRIRIRCDSSRLKESQRKQLNSDAAGT